MNKKLAHTILLVGTLACFAGLWFGYHDLKLTLREIASQPDSISFGNRDGFFIVALGFPIIHLLIVVEQFRPALVNKYKRFMNIGAIFMVISLLAAGFICSSWIESQVQKAGYIYCREASGISALAKSLVYAKNRDICADLATGKKIP